MITFTDVDKSYGRQALLLGANLALHPGEKVGLVGPNGAGKSTIFRLIVGEERPDAGEVRCPKRITIGYFRQDAAEARGRTVLDEAILGSGRLGQLHGELAQLEVALADPDQADQMETVLERFGEVQGEYAQMGGYELEARAMEVLHGLGFDDLQIRSDVGQLSGGWRMRVAMAQVLIGKPDVLLMDEPTNHLDLDAIVWLEQFLANSECAVLLTCHDRDFMNRVVSRILAIDGGELTSYTGDYDFYLRQQELRVERDEAAYARQQKMLEKEERFIARFERHAAKAAQVQSRVKKLDKIDKLEPPKRRVLEPFEFRDPPRSGNDVLQMKSVCKAFGSKVVYRNLDFAIQRGERWCVMGTNGAGKSTLLKMVAGELNPDAGEVKLGASLKLGYFAQVALEILDPNHTVWQEIDTAFPVATIPSKRSLLGAFDFPGDEIEKPVRVLSGGERSRLVLARMLYDPPNFLVLDEPTNHLDFETKQMLIQTLRDFSGTMLFVSHDRTFLRGLSTRVLDLSAEGGPRVFHGSYSAWVEHTGREAPGVHA